MIITVGYIRRATSKRTVGLEINNGTIECATTYGTARIRDKPEIKKKMNSITLNMKSE